VTPAEVRHRLNPLLAEHRRAAERVTEEEGNLRRAQQGVTDATQAQSLVQAVAEAVQTAAHRQLDAVVTRSLKAVFGKDAYAFHIGFVKKRGRREAELTLAEGEHVLDKPLSQGAGGQCDVAAFALRCAQLLLERPARRRVLFLDQPFAHINGEE